MNVNSHTQKHELKDKTLITLQNVSVEDIYEILHLARDIKKKQTVGEKINSLQGQHIALLTKPSYVRSRITFQIAVSELGGNPITVSLPGSSIAEELKDQDTTEIVKRLGVSAVVVDTEFLHDAEVLENYSTMPVINANGRTSPCQSLAALLTIWEQKGTLQGLKMTVIGNVDNGDYSLFAGAAKCGIDLAVVCPEGSEPPSEILNYCGQFGFVEVFDNSYLFFCFCRLLPIHLHFLLFQLLFSHFVFLVLLLFLFFFLLVVFFILNLLQCSIYFNMFVQ